MSLIGTDGTDDIWWSSTICHARALKLAHCSQDQLTDCIQSSPVLSQACASQPFRVNATNGGCIKFMKNPLIFCENVCSLGQVDNQLSRPGPCLSADADTVFLYYCSQHVICRLCLVTLKGALACPSPGDILSEYHTTPVRLNSRYRIVLLRQDKWQRKKNCVSLLLCVLWDSCHHNSLVLWDELYNSVGLPWPASLCVCVGDFFSFGQGVYDTLSQWLSHPCLGACWIWFSALHLSSISWKVAAHLSITPPHRRCIRGWSYMPAGMCGYNCYCMCMCTFKIIASFCH